MALIENQFVYKHNKREITSNGVALR